ncbi:hypothetical protein DERP_011994 [Dermatophagoides pteronyssinus]|uniref:Uncharacterized protein n=1 Tax=Dermatophagoides pteronyssinus TaxID=6956 RepID=A0ABQ8IVR8_DERPT|nr:hypothetical protein DERP_011994 [Dermatophagoides pteronyssinus]
MANEQQKQKLKILFHSLDSTGNYSKFGFKELLLINNDDDRKTTEEQNVEPKTSSSNHPNANNEKKIIHNIITLGILSSRSSLEK